MVHLTIDDREFETKETRNVLQACLENRIYVPNLCYVDGMDHPPACCRMCFVEIEGKDRPVPSCTVTVRDGMVVKTETPFVRRLQRSALKLLLSAHEVDCAQCPVNKRCELQRIARFLKVGLKANRLEKLLKDPATVQESPLFDFHPNRCILCGKCIHVGLMEPGRLLLSFAGRGFNTVISAYGEESLLEVPLETVTACAEICPVSAITIKQGRS